MSPSDDRLFTPRFFTMCGFTFTVFLSAFQLLPTAPFRILRAFAPYLRAQFEAEGPWLWLLRLRRPCDLGGGRPGPRLRCAVRAMPSGYSWAPIPL